MIFASSIMNIHSQRVELMVLYNVIISTNRECSVECTAFLALARSARAHDAHARMDQMGLVRGYKITDYTVSWMQTA